MDEKDIAIVKTFIHQAKQGLDENDCVDICPLMLKYKYFHVYMKSYVKEYENENKTYTYMITFTIDPKKHDVKDTKLHDIIAEYVVGFACKRNALRADVVKEGTDEDHKHTHWHLGLELKKYLDFFNFLKYYRKIYGKVDVSRSWSNDYNNVLIYINKSIPSEQITNIKP